LLATVALASAIVAAFAVVAFADAEGCCCLPWKMLNEGRSFVVLTAGPAGLAGLADPASFVDGHASALAHRWPS